MQRLELTDEVIILPYNAFRPFSSIIHRSTPEFFSPSSPKPTIVSFGFGAESEHLLAQRYLQNKFEIKEKTHIAYDYFQQENAPRRGYDQVIEPDFPSPTPHQLWDAVKELTNSPLVDLVLICGQSINIWDWEPTYTSTLPHLKKNGAIATVTMDLGAPKIEKSALEAQAHRELIDSLDLTAPATFQKYSYHRNPMTVSWIPYQG